MKRRELIAHLRKQNCVLLREGAKHTPDALHIAAGHLSGSDEIWTTDGKLVKKSQAGLLVPTPVCFPYVTQPRLPL